MAWPSAATKTHLDESTDDPSQARAELAALVDKVNALINEALPAANYTAADVLTKILSMDGSGSTLDADTLDGLHASAFASASQGAKADNALPAANYTASDVIAKVKTADGTGSGLDADLLDGQHASAFVAKTVPGTYGSSTFKRLDSLEHWLVPAGIHLAYMSTATGGLILEYSINSAWRSQPFEQPMLLISDGTSVRISDTGLYPNPELFYRTLA